MAAQASHLLPLDGLRMFWARRAVQMCIGSDAKLISTIVAEESIGGIHLADFTTLLRHAGDLDQSCADGTAMATHVKGLVSAHAYTEGEIKMWRRCSMLRDLRGAPLWILATALLLSFAGGTAFAADPVKVGHVAALSGASAQSGEAITRGLTLAIDEINGKGGLLGGRKLELIQRDDESNPPRGLIAARELIFQEKVAAIFGGIDTPVSLAIVPLVNKEKTLLMGVWAAGTGITRNGANPNYVFRVSAVDDDVDIKLLKYANEKFKAKKAGLMLINNPWGQSNEKGLIAAAKDNSAITIAGVSKFENNDVDMVPHLTRLKEAGADAIILVVNAPPGAQMMKSRERMGWTVPVVSHWGISGGRFPSLRVRLPAMPTS